MVTARLEGLLPPHPWDDPDHRRAIHEAFDKWFIAYDCKAIRQEQFWRVRLRKLCLDAQLRRATMDPTYDVVTALAERGEEVA